MDPTSLFAQGNSRVQSGYKNQLAEAAAGWQAGWESLAQTYAQNIGSRSHPSAPTNHTINNNYTIIPFINSDKNAEFAFKMPIFSWGDEHEGLLQEARTHLGITQLRDRFDLSMKRAKTKNGMPYSNINQGMNAGGEAILALNLPMLNWLLANVCNDYVETNGPLDPLTLAKKIKPLGVCITSRNHMLTSATSSNGVYGMKTDVRTITNCGMVDVYNIWGATKIGEKPLKFSPGSTLYFLLVKENVKLNTDGKKNLVYFLNGSDAEGVVYKKDYIWKVVPYVGQQGERVSTSEIRKKYEDLGYVWRFGRVSTFPAKRTNGDLNVTGDVCTDAREIQNLSVLEIMCDYIGKQSLFAALLNEYVQNTKIKITTFKKATASSDVLETATDWKDCIDEQDSYGILDFIPDILEKEQFYNHIMKSTSDSFNNVNFKELSVYPLFTKEEDKDVFDINRNFLNTQYELSKNLTNLLDKIEPLLKYIDHNSISTYNKTKDTIDFKYLKGSFGSVQVLLDELEKYSKEPRMDPDISGIKIDDSMNIKLIKGIMNVYKLFFGIKDFDKEIIDYSHHIYKENEITVVEYNEKIWENTDDPLIFNLNLIEKFEGDRHVNTEYYNADVFELGLIKQMYAKYKIIMSKTPNIKNPLQLHIICEIIIDLLRNINFISDEIYHEEKEKITQFMLSDFVITDGWCVNTEINGKFFLIITESNKSKLIIDHAQTLAKYAVYLDAATKGYLQNDTQQKLIDLLTKEIITDDDFDEINQSIEKNHTV